MTSAVRNLNSLKVHSLHKPITRAILQLQSRSAQVEKIGDSFAQKFGWPPVPFPDSNITQSDWINRGIFVGVSVLGIIVIGTLGVCCFAKCKERCSRESEPLLLQRQV